MCNKGVMRLKVAVIADDLTGANAAGILFTTRGFSTATILNDSEDMANSNYDVICVNANTRYSPQKKANNRIRHLTSILLKNQPEIICKRIDSTVRGNIGTEIDAVLDSIGHDAAAIVVPSFPSSGRTMVGGYLLVNGVPVQETEVAKDPIVPLKQSYVPDIIKKQSIRQISLIDIGTILLGKEKLLAVLDQHIQSGAKIIVIDAVTNDHIEVIADAMANLPFSFVPVDPGPLSAAYAYKKIKNSIKEPQIILSIGSCTSLSRLQLMYFIKESNVHPIYVSPYDLAINEKFRRAEISRAILEGSNGSRKDQPLVVSTLAPDQDIIQLSEIAKLQNVTEEEVSKSITEGLAEITMKIIEQNPLRFSGVFSSGGDVTASLCRISGVHGIELIDEVVPLVAYGKLTGGILNGMHIVTKGGLIGKERTIFHCVEVLKSKIHQEKLSISHS